MTLDKNESKHASIVLTNIPVQCENVKQFITNKDKINFEVDIDSKHAALLQAEMFFCIKID